MSYEIGIIILFLFFQISKIIVEKSKGTILLNRFHFFELYKYYILFIHSSIIQGKNVNIHIIYIHQHDCSDYYSIVSLYFQGHNNTKDPYYNY